MPTGPEDRDLVLKVSSKGRQGRGLLASSESLNDCKGLHLEINRWPHGYWSIDRKLAKGLLLHLLSQILSPLSTWTLLTEGISHALGSEEFPLPPLDCRLSVCRCLMGPPP